LEQGHVAASNDDDAIHGAEGLDHHCVPRSGTGQRSCTTRQTSGAYHAASGADLIPAMAGDDDEPLRLELAGRASGARACCGAEAMQNLGIAISSWCPRLREDDDSTGRDSLTRLVSSVARQYLRVSGGITARAVLRDTLVPG